MGCQVTPIPVYDRTHSWRNELLCWLAVSMENECESPSYRSVYFLSGLYQLAIRFQPVQTQIGRNKEDPRTRMWVLWNAPDSGCRRKLLNSIWRANLCYCPCWNGTAQKVQYSTCIDSCQVLMVQHGKKRFMLKTKIKSSIIISWKFRNNLNRWNSRLEVISMLLSSKMISLRGANSVLCSSKESEQWRGEQRDWTSSSVIWRMSCGNLPSLSPLFPINCNRARVHSLGGEAPITVFTGLLAQSWPPKRRQMVPRWQLTSWKPCKRFAQGPRRRRRSASWGKKEWALSTKFGDTRFSCSLTKSLLRMLKSNMFVARRAKYAFSDRNFYIWTLQELLRLHRYWCFCSLLSLPCCFSCLRELHALLPAVLCEAMIKKVQVHWPLQAWKTSRTPHWESPFTPADTEKHHNNETNYLHSLHKRLLIWLMMIYQNGSISTKILSCLHFNTIWLLNSFGHASSTLPFIGKRTLLISAQIEQSESDVRLFLMSDYLTMKVLGDTISFAEATHQALMDCPWSLRTLMITTSSKNLQNSLISLTTMNSMKRNSTSTSILVLESMKTKTGLSPVHPQEIILLMLPLTVMM